MNFYSIKIKFLFYLVLGVFSFYVNYFFSNKGLFPIDTFSFFDTGYLITQGYHPIRDFWVISGIFIDYIQALFFIIFGFNWNAYIFHSSFFNMILSLFFYFFLNNLNKNFFINFLLSVSVAILCYPVSGTPFPYQHSYIISLISLLVFYLAVYKDNQRYWLILPVTMLLSFVSMQMPSGLINVLILLFTLIYYIKFKKKFLLSFLKGVCICLILIIFYFSFLNVNFKDFLIQIFLFPFSVGEGRILGDESSYASANLFNKFTFRGVFGHFKFIILFLVANLISIYLYINKVKKFDKFILLNALIVLCGISFIFHQLITANQTFIFSLIPILGGLFIVQLKDFFNIDKIKFNFFIILLIFFTTIKYNYVYNIKRKFMDLQQINFDNSIKAEKLNKKFKNLDWITPFYYSDKSAKELDLLKETIKVLSLENHHEIIIITHYQFFSLLLEKKIRILNRWYFPENNTHPTSVNNKYYSHYVTKNKNIIKNNDIKKIFLVNTYPEEFSFINIKDLLINQCFTKQKYNIMLSVINIKPCN